MSIFTHYPENHSGFFNGLCYTFGVFVLECRTETVSLKLQFHIGVLRPRHPMRLWKYSKRMWNWITGWQWDIYKMGVLGYQSNSKRDVLSVPIFRGNDMMFGECWIPERNEELKSFCPSSEKQVCDRHEKTYSEYGKTSDLTHWVWIWCSSLATWIWSSGLTSILLPQSS